MTITAQTVDDLRAELAILIRDTIATGDASMECDMQWDSLMVLKGARLMVERAEQIAGVPHKHVTANDAPNAPTIHATRTAGA